MVDVLLSGKFVPKSGVTARHHVLPLREGSEFRFRSGDFDLTVTARVYGISTPIALWQGTISLPESIVPDPVHQQAWFDQDPTIGMYKAKLRSGREGAF